MPVDVGEALASYLQRGPGRAPPAAVSCSDLRAEAELCRAAWRVNVVRSACRRCGLPVVCAHALRHTAATETLRAGASLEEIGRTAASAEHVHHRDLRPG